VGVEAVAEAIISIVAAVAAAEAVVVDFLLLLKRQAEGSRFAPVVFATLKQDIEVIILFAKTALEITCNSLLAVSMAPNDCRIGKITRHALTLRGREAVVVVDVAVVETISNNSNMGNNSSSSSSNSNISSNRPIMGRQDLRQMCKILSKILSSYFQLLHNRWSFNLKRICLFCGICIILLGVHLLILFFLAEETLNLLREQIESLLPMEILLSLILGREHSDL